LTQPDRALFREESLNRYAAARQNRQTLRDIPSRLLLLLWVGVGIAGASLTGIVLCVATMVR